MQIVKKNLHSLNLSGLSIQAILHRILQRGDVVKVISRTKLDEYEEDGCIITKYRTEFENGIVGIGTNKHPILTDEQKLLREKSIGRTYLKIKMRLEDEGA